MNEAKNLFRVEKYHGAIVLNVCNKRANFSKEFIESLKEELERIDSVVFLKQGANSEKKKLIENIIDEIK